MVFKTRAEKEKERQAGIAQLFEDYKKVRRPEDGEVQPERHEPVKKKTARDIIDIIIKFLPGVAAAFGAAKWFVEIVRCLTSGVYKEQLSSCTKLFSLDFLPRYYEPVLLWVAGVSVAVCLAASVIRFFIWAKKGKKTAVVVLFLLSLLCAVPFLAVWRLYDHYDAPTTQAFLRFVGEDRIHSFFQAYPWVYKSAFPYITLGLSALFMLIGLVKILWDDDSGNADLSEFLILWAAVIFLGIPLLILMTQNAVLAMLLAAALIMLIAVFSRVLRILLAVIAFGGAILAAVTTMSFAPLIVPAILILIIVLLLLLPSSGAKGSDSSDDSEDSCSEVDTMLDIKGLMKERRKKLEEAARLTELLSRHESWTTENSLKGTLNDVDDLERQIQEKCADIGKDLLEADPATLDRDKLVRRIKEYVKESCVYEGSPDFNMKDRREFNRTMAKAYADATEKLKELLYKMD